MRARHLALIGFLLFGPDIGVSPAQEVQPATSSQVTPEAPAAASPKDAPKAPSPLQVTYASGLLSVTAKDADVRLLVETIAARSGVEIVLDKAITGKTTVDFAGVALEEGLRNVLHAVVAGGFAMEYARRGDAADPLDLKKVTIARVASGERGNGDAAVAIETYSPEVVVEGAWGEEPGKFGLAWSYPHSLLPESPSMGPEPFYPPSIAVNSRGEVYILDPVNNRIQKFSGTGAFIRSLPVKAYEGVERPIWYGRVPRQDGAGTILDRVPNKTEGEIGVDRWFPFYNPITTKGINIVIDAEDTLFYYRRILSGTVGETHPSRYDGTVPPPYGEVLVFRDDALVNTVKVPVVDTIYGLRRDWDDSIWVGIGDYEVRAGKPKERNLNDIRLKDGRRIQFGKPPTQRGTISIFGITGVKEQTISYGRTDDREPFVASTYFVTRQGEVFVYHGWHRRGEREAYLDKYSADFNLMSTAQLPDDPRKYLGREIDLLRSVIDDQGNLYSLSVTNNGVKAIRWRRR